MAATGVLVSVSATGASPGAARPPAAASASAQLSPVRIYPGVALLARSKTAGPGGGLTPQQIRAAYGLPLLTDLNGPGPLKGITGAGQTIVIVDSFGSPTIAHDLTKFDATFGVPAPPSFKVIQPAGKVSKFHGSNSNRVGWAQETTLDVEWAHVMAPGASIVLAETPTSENEGTTGFPQIVTAEKYVLSHKLGQVISQSFAATEQTFPSQAALRGLRGAYQLAGKDHVTVLAATGDEGATGYRYNMQDLFTTRAVSWPATDPLVTAVGGTQLALRASGARRLADVAWSGSGGGQSIVFARPAYQYSVRKLTGGHRGVPDISMDASCASTVAVYGSFGGMGGWGAICGTSVATPLFAGIVALADQVAGHSLGLINPAIYQIAIRHEPGIVDVRKGNNTATFYQNGKSYTVPGFAARKGYDLVSGVGTVNAAYFVPELARLAG
ncbi:MAG: S8 family serine peptidase [Streptosporangiaceae bacterium]